MSPRPAREQHGRSKVTLAQVQEMRRRVLEEKATASGLAREYGIHGSTVLQILHGTTWGLPGVLPKRIKQKITPPMQEVVQNRYRAGETMQSLANDYGVSITTIFNVVRGRVGQQPGITDRVKPHKAKTLKPADPIQA